MLLQTGEQKIQRRAVALNGGVLNGLIFDDFYFLNCHCKEYIAQKGNRTRFLLGRKRQITERVMIKIAKEVNPDSADGLLHQRCVEAEEIIMKV